MWCWIHFRPRSLPPHLFHNGSHFITCISHCPEIQCFETDLNGFVITRIFYLSSSADDALDGSDPQHLHAVLLGVSNGSRRTAGLAVEGGKKKVSGLQSCKRLLTSYAERKDLI